MLELILGVMICDTVPNITRFLAEERKQYPAYSGTTSHDIKLKLYTNPSQKTWTLVKIDVADNAGCVVAMGNKFKQLTMRM